MSNFCKIKTDKILVKHTSVYEFGGNLFFPTTCMFPNGDHISVRMECLSSGNFLIDDAGSAFDELSINGIKAETAKKYKKAEEIAEVFGIDFDKKEQKFLLKDVSESQLFSAISYLANCVQKFTNDILLETLDDIKETLNNKTFDIIKSFVPVKNLAKDYEIKGFSNKKHKFDIGIINKDKVILVSSVPNHHISISTNFTRFADVKKSSPKQIIDAVISSNDNWANEDKLLIGEFVDEIEIIEEGFKSLRKRFS